MTEVQLSSAPRNHYIKPDSSTTKLRVVFDALALSSTGKSLNILRVGPTAQSELLLYYYILLRF